MIGDGMRARELQTELKTDEWFVRKTHLKSGGLLAGG